MKRKNVAGEFVEAMREAVAIAKGEQRPAAEHRFALRQRDVCGESCRGSFGSLRCAPVAQDDRYL